MNCRNCHKEKKEKNICLIEHKKTNYGYKEFVIYCLCPECFIHLIGEDIRKYKFNRSNNPAGICYCCKDISCCSPNHYYYYDYDFNKMSLCYTCYSKYFHSYKLDPPF